VRGFRKAQTLLFVRDASPEMSGSRTSSWQAPKLVQIGRGRTGETVTQLSMRWRSRQAGAGHLLSDPAMNMSVLRDETRGDRIARQLERDGVPRRRCTRTARRASGCARLRDFKSVSGAGAGGTDIAGAHRRGRISHVVI